MPRKTKPTAKTIKLALPDEFIALCASWVFRSIVTGHSGLS